MIYSRVDMAIVYCEIFRYSGMLALFQTFHCQIYNLDRESLTHVYSRV